jgi:DNA repair exonuclease SbcCD ATPase subunit
MKIKKLNLTNFRSHPDTTIDNLPRFVVIRGSNHSGKTSLVHALELSLAGRAAPTDDRGAGAKELVRTGAEGGKAIVKLRLQNDPAVDEFRDVRCSLTLASGRTVQVNNPADKEAKGDDFAYWLTTKRDIFSCLINGGYFVNLPDKDQKALLAGIVLPEVYEGWDKDMIGRMQDLKLKFNPAGKPFEEIASAYKLAFDERRDVNRDIKNHVIPEGDTTLAGDVARLRGEITDCEQKRDSLIRKKTQIEDADSAREQKLTSLTGQREKATAKLSTEQQAVESFKKKVLSKAVLKDTQALAAKKDKAAELDTAITVATTRIAEYKDALAKVMELDKNPNCPRCRQAISEEQVALIAEPLIEKRNAEEDKLAALREERRGLGDYEKAIKDIATHTQAKIDLERSELRVTEAHKELEHVNAQINGIGPAPAVDDELLEAIAEAKRKVQEATDRLEPVITANNLKKAKEEARAKGQALQLKLSKLEELVKYFGPGDAGIQAKLLSEHVGAFQVSMNKVLASWGYECSLSFEPYVFGIKRGDTTLALNLLSGSEQHQFAIAFQVALAIHSGLLFAVVDASEIYDSAGRKQMFGALLNAGLDQVIVLGTDQRTEVPANQDQLAYYMFSAEKIDDVVTTTVSRLLPAA